MSWQRLVLPVYWVVLAVATHYPTVPVPRTVEHSDKLIHFGAFALLATFFWWFLEARALTARSVWIVAAVLIPYSAIDEYTQQFFGRNVDLADGIANALGIASALAVLEIRRRRYSK